MSLIVMAIFDQIGSGRTELTEKTLQNLLDTVDFRRNDICLVDNASCPETQSVIMSFCKIMDDDFPGHAFLFHNQENVGTAKAINQGIILRKPGQTVIKMDNDVIIHQRNWIDIMEDALHRSPKIGILGLKRKDLMEWPGHPEANWRSTLHMLPHKPGERWLIFEQVRGVMGTCTMYNPLLLDKIGFLNQPSKYGYDDSLISGRSELAGFINGFLPSIEIDHIDPGGTFYQKWKEDEAAIRASEANQIMAEYLNGTRNLYENA